jgi:transcriptional regulator with XRE-family HTH domain
MKTDELLDQARQKQGLSDSELAGRLHISRQKVSDYRHGKRPIPDKHVTALATLANLDPAATLASVRAAHAPPETATVWQEIARRAALATAVIGAISANPLSPGTAYAGKSLHNLYIMSIRRFRGLTSRRPLAPA